MKSFCVRPMIRLMRAKPITLVAMVRSARGTLVTSIMTMAPTKRSTLVMMLMMVSVSVMFTVSTSLVTRLMILP